MSKPNHRGRSPKVSNRIRLAQKFERGGRRLFKCPHCDEQIEPEQWNAHSAACPKNPHAIRN